MSPRFDKKMLFLLFGLLFVFACSLGTPAPVSEAPAFDATKASLELEATAMVLQLTQVAIENNQSAPAAAAATPVPQQATAAPSPASPAMPNFDKWIKSANILLFEDMAGSVRVRRYISQALDGMGLTYTDVGDALGNYKNEINSGGPGGNGWDLIISGKELRTGVQGEFYVYLNAAINDGSSVIIEEWDMDSIGAGKISRVMSQCGVVFHRDWIQKPIEDHLLVPHSSDHRIHHKPNDGIALTNPSGFWLGTDLGDLMQLSPGSDAVPIWGLFKSTPNNYLTAVSCVDDRVIIQTYSTHSYGESRVIQMWENYIYNTLRARYDYLATH